MKRLDLDDLPPKAAALLAGAQPGEEIALVKDGLVVGRLVGGGESERDPQTAADPGQTPEDRAPEDHSREIFELFRASVEDEF